MAAKKKTTKRKAAPKHVASKHAAQKHVSVEVCITPAHWNIVLVAVAAILIIGIFAGVAKLVQEQRTEPVVVAGSMQNLFTATHSQAEVDDLANLAMSRLRFAGEIESSFFDTKTGKWTVTFEAISSTGTVPIRVKIDDVSMQVNEAALLIPLPEITPVMLSPGNDPVLGPENARVTMYLFIDFECPFSGMAADTVGELMDEYEGRVKFVFKNFPLNSIHPNARKAAEAGECAHEQGKFWEYHDMLFDNQGALETEYLKAYATQLELDMDAFNACLDSGSMAQEVEADYQEGVAEGVGSTPTFYVNQQIMSGAISKEIFIQIIEKELAE